MSLPIKLEIYEGPLDLLLHLIKKSEVDIYDIPIALITSQYLEYLELMDFMNVELAGEFLVMAATLTQIKSKLLLPVSEDEEETDEEDPRMAIIRPLIEHMKIKDAAESLARKELLNRDVFSRTGSMDEFDGDRDEQLEPVSLFDLMDSFRSVLARLEKKAGIEFILETKSIEERIGEIIELLKQKPELLFEELFIHDHTKAELVLTFLALLELARIGILSLFQHPAQKQVKVFYSHKRALSLVENEDDETEPEMDVSDSFSYNDSDNEDTPA